MPTVLARIASPVTSLRTRVRAVPGGGRLWQLAVIAVGGLLIAGGVVLLVLPGPGWLIIFFGLSVLATEFTWAARLLTWTRLQVARFTRWAAQRSTAARVAGSTASVVVVVALVVGFIWYRRS